MFTIYRVTGSTTRHAYYGYAAGSLTDAQKTFSVGANRSDSERIDVQFAERAGVLSFESLSECEDEGLAMVIRNEYRVADTNSISGPTNWPAMVHRAAHDQYGDRAERPVQLYKAMQKPTARDAYAAGAFTTAALRTSVSAKGAARDDVAADLDLLSPREFIEKYDIEVMYAM